MNLNELKKAVKTESKNWAEDAIKYLDECETIEQKEEFAKRYNKKPLEALYKAENKRLKNHSEVTRRDFIGYGSGYSSIPRFEGGVGFRSHETILNNLNFKTTLYDESSATYDLYIFEA